MKTWLMGGNPHRETNLNSGQVIILVAVSMIALLAIIGLAIDGGRLLLLRRDAQNANDAAVLASIFSLCTGGTSAQVQAAGLSSASANGFANGSDNTVVTVIPNPPGLPAEACAECSVQVDITREIEPYFIQLVYGGRLEVTTSAVGTCNPDSVPVMEDTDNDGEPDAPKPPMAAFWAGAPPGACTNHAGVDIQGSDMIIKGNIHSNSDVKMNPSNQASGDTCDSVPNDPQGAWTFGNITYSNPGGASGFQDSKSNNCDWDQAPGETADTPVCGANCLVNNGDGPDGDNDAELVDPYLNADGSVNWPVDHTIEQFRDGGSVESAINQTDGTEAGEASQYDNYFYFVSGSAPACNGSGANMTWDDIPAVFKNADGSLKPAIYYSDCNIRITRDLGVGNTATFVAEGEISVTSTMELTAYHDELLFFANGPSTPSCNQNGVHISSSNSVFEGNIFAPNGNAQFSAASNNATVHGCVIAYSTSNSGSQLALTCDPGEETDRGAISFQD